MKSILLALIFSFPIILSAQNWAPINPDRSPQYALEGGDNIDFSIKIDSIVTDAMITWYYLHPVYLKSDSSLVVVPDCPFQYDTLYLKQTPLLGDSIMLHEGSYWFYGPNLVIKPNNSLNSTYNFMQSGSEALTVTVTETAELEVFGVLDSIKVFFISDDREVVISKNYGIISITELSGSTQSLSGIPELQLGNYFPGMRDFYNFEPGDAFFYAGTTGSAQGTYAWLIRVDITDVLIYPDSVKITYNTIEKTTLWSSDPAPISTTTVISENNVQTVSFENQSLQGIIPGMISYDIDAIQMFSANTNAETSGSYYNSYQAIATEHNGRQGLSIGGFTANFEPYDLSYEYVNPVGVPGNAVKARRLICVPEDGLTNYLLNDSLAMHYGNMGSCEVFAEYTEGLGATFFYNDCGLARNLTYMIGFQKGGETFGNIITLDEISDAREILAESDVKVFPNPASTHITVSVPDKYSGTFNVSLTDMTGRRVLNQNNINSNSSIDIHKLPSGTYILFGTNAEFTFTRKVVVK